MGQIATSIDGLDEAIIGLKEGETRVFTTTLSAGEHAGKEAQVTVTVKSVKELLALARRRPAGPSRGSSASTARG